MSGEPVSGDRVFFRDLKPYAVVDSLDQLLGPAGGTIRLPHWVLWIPGREIDLDEPGGVGVAYRAVLSEGSVDDIVTVVNRDRLIRVWGSLLLPRRVRDLWESRFAELRLHQAHVDHDRPMTTGEPDASGPGDGREGVS
jgi:hypothetical protein